MALVVEVADATLQRDRTLKLRVYASARIPIYWILNLQDARLEVYRDPVGEGAAAAYGRRTDYQPSDDAPVEIEGRAVARVTVRDLLA